jgi:hypothetical protein
MGKISAKKFREELKGTRGNITILAQKLGVSRLTVYNFLEKKPFLKKELENEAETRQDIAEAQLDKAISQGESWAVQTALLKHKRGRNRGYGDHIEVDQSTEMTIRDKIIKDEELLSLLPDELKQKMINKNE